MRSLLLFGLLATALLAGMTATAFAIDPLPAPSQLDSADTYDMVGLDNQGQPVDYTIEVTGTSGGYVTEFSDPQGHKWQWNSQDKRYDGQDTGDENKHYGFAAKPNGSYRYEKIERGDPDSTLEGGTATKN